MSKTIFSIMLIIISAISIPLSYAKTKTHDQVALLQFHRFNQLQMQMAKMTNTKSKDKEVKGLASKVYKLHRNINDKVTTVAEEAGLNLLDVPKEVEQHAKSEYRDDFVEIAQEIQESGSSKIDVLYPTWVKKTNKAMHEKLKESVEKIESSNIKSFMKENMQKIKSTIL